MTASANESSASQLVMCGPGFRGFRPGPNITILGQRDVGCIHLTRFTPTTPTHSSYLEDQSRACTLNLGFWKIDRGIIDI